MEHPHLMPGTPVRDGDLKGQVSSRYTTRTEDGPHREITVTDEHGRETVYVNDEINRLEVS